MRAMDKRRLESALRDGFRQERRSAGRPACHREAVAALAAAEAAKLKGRDAGAGDFAWVVVRFSPCVFWVVPAAVVVLSLLLVLFGASAFGCEAALVASGPALAAACLVGVVRARSCLMQELEASCLRNAVSVACARLAVFGGVTLLALALACAVCSAVVPAAKAAAYALAPYLVAAAGGLMFARRVSSVDTGIATVAWSAGVCTLCALLRVALPEAYGDAAVWAWAAVAALGALWCAREVFEWLRLCAQGGVSAEAARCAGAL